MSQRTDMRRIMVTTLMEAEQMYQDEKTNLSHTVKGSYGECLSGQNRMPTRMFFTCLFTI
jgi:hypothetical protein